MAANDNAISCGKGDFTLMDLITGAIGKDVSGKATLRMYESSAVAGSKFADCANHATPEDALRSLFTLDSNGDIALRVSILP